MSYQLVQADDNKALIYVIVGAIVFFVFILPKLEKCYARDNSQIKEKMKSLTSHAHKDIVKMDKKKCAKECCAWTQWPVPHMPKTPDEYEGTNFMCNGGPGGGCLCVTEKDREYLAKRAHNFLPCKKKQTKINYYCN